MNRRITISLLVAVAVAAFGLTQVEFFALRQEPSRTHEAAIKQISAPATPQPATVPAKQPSPGGQAKPQDKFIVNGDSIIHLHADGSQEIVLSDVSTKMGIGVSGSAEVIAHVEKDTVVLAPSCWEGNGQRKLYKLDVVARTLTVMKSEIPCQAVSVEPEDVYRLSEYLIYPGSAGDSFIWVDLIHDTMTQTAVLPKPYTYIQSNDESGYSDFIIGTVQWDNQAFVADVFDGVPIDLFDRRLPVMEKYISTP